MCQCIQGQNLITHHVFVHCMVLLCITIPNSKVHGVNMGPIWSQQDPGVSYVGPLNFDIWDVSGDT